MPGRNGVQNVGDIDIGDPVRRAVGFCIHREPVTAQVNLVELAMTGIINQQVILFGQLLT